MCHDGCAFDYQAVDPGVNPSSGAFFFSQTFFVMDKKRAIRVPKARSYGIESPTRAPRAQLYGTRPSLHDRVGTFASIYVYIAEG